MIFRDDSWVQQSPVLRHLSSHFYRFAFWFDFDFWRSKNGYSCWELLHNQLWRIVSQSATSSSILALYRRKACIEFFSCVTTTSDPPFQFTSLMTKFHLPQHKSTIGVFISIAITDRFLFSNFLCVIFCKSVVFSSSVMSRISRAIQHSYCMQCFVWKRGTTARRLSVSTLSHFQPVHIHVFYSGDVVHQCLWLPFCIASYYILFSSLIATRSKFLHKESKEISPDLSMYRFRSVSFLAHTTFE